MEQIQKKKRVTIDFILIAIILMLMITGLLMLSNATGKPKIEQGSSWLEYAEAMNKYVVTRHVIWFGLGCVLAGIIMYFDYSIYGSLSMLLYIIVIALLACVLIFGTEQYGQYRWEIADQEIQPSEIGKLVLILVLAWDFSKLDKGITTLKQLFFALLKVAIPLAFILMQPDIGTTVVYIFIAAVMLFACGTKMWMLYSLLGTALVAVIPIWGVLGDPQKYRILTFIDPTIDPTGSGYNVIHSKMAIGSGQMFGKGFFNPIAMSQLNYIPVQESDFIFAVTGETVGFWGCLVIVLLFAALILRMVMMANRIDDKFGSFIIIGVAAMMFVHIFENIGMAIGIMPVTGIPLPYFSYGGSSMITNIIGIGLVECVWLRRKKGLGTHIVKFK